MPADEFFKKATAATEATTGKKRTSEEILAEFAPIVAADRKKGEN